MTDEERKALTEEELNNVSGAGYFDTLKNIATGMNGVTKIVDSKGISEAGLDLGSGGSYAVYDDNGTLVGYAETMQEAMEIMRKLQYDPSYTWKGRIMQK